MTNRVQTLRSSIAGNRPTGRTPGELYVNWPDAQFGVINFATNPQDLIAIRFFSTGANYVVGDHVIQSGTLYKANTTVVPGAFNVAQWTLVGAAGSPVTIGDLPPNAPKSGDLWWDDVGGQLYVYYYDGNSYQWVVANNSGPLASTTPPLMNGAAAVGTSSLWARGDHVHPTDTSLYPVTNPAGYQTAAQIAGAYLPLAGGTVTGNLTVNGASTFSGTMSAAQINATGYWTNGNAQANGTGTFGTANITTLNVSGNAAITGTLSSGKATLGFGSSCTAGMGAWYGQAALSLAGGAGVGTTSVAVYAGAAAGYIGMFSRADRTDCYLAYFNWGGTQGVGTITTNGTNTAYNTSSDYRLKIDFGEIDRDVIGSMIDGVKVHDAEWKAAAAVRAVESTIQHVYRYPMFFAHELKEACPWAVLGEKDELDDEGKIKPQQMDASKVVPVLWAEIQNLRKRVAQLEGAR